MTANADHNPQDEAKQKLRQWLMSDELREYMVRAKEAKRTLDRLGPHITISRQAGAGGRELALQVARTLNWDVLDREFLDFMAERYQLPRHGLEFVDETQTNWIDDIFGSWFNARVVSHQKYLVHLERLIWLAAVHGRVIFVGRGAQFILPKGQGLSVRVTANLEDQIARMLERGVPTREAAIARIKKVDEQRRVFIRQYFQKDIDDLSLYDLTLDTSELGIEGAAEKVLKAYEQRHGAVTKQS